MGATASRSGRGENLSGTAWRDVFSYHRSPEAKKQCRVSRSFESYVENFKELEQRIISYATRASEKIRSDQLQAKRITVFIRSNKFNKKTNLIMEIKLIALFHQLMIYLK